MMNQGCELDIRWYDVGCWMEDYGYPSLVRTHAGIKDFAAVVYIILFH